MEENRIEVKEKVIEKHIPFEVVKVEEVKIEQEIKLTAFKRSDDITELLKSLVAFHTEFEGVDKSIENGFFKNKYADLNAILREVRPILSKNKLILMQFPIDAGEGRLSIKTILTHENGQFVESDYAPVKPPKHTSQDMGAIQTYARRYSISAILAISFDADDDGNSTSVTAKPTPTTTPKTTTPLRGGRL